MSELDKAISELVSAFQEIMPSAQVFVAQAKPKDETEVKPNAKATALSPEAEYWRQKYMNTLDKYNTLLAGQSIRTKTHDQERSTIANLQGQVRDLTATRSDSDRSEEEPRDPRPEGGPRQSRQRASRRHRESSGDRCRAA